MFKLAKLSKQILFSLLPPSSQYYEASLPSVLWFYVPWYVIQIWCVTLTLKSYPYTMNGWLPKPQVLAPLAGVCVILKSQWQKANGEFKLLGWFEKVSKLFPNWWKLNPSKTPCFREPQSHSLFSQAGVDTFPGISFSIPNFQELSYVHPLKSRTPVWENKLETRRDKEAREVEVIWTRNWSTLKLKRKPWLLR